MGHIRAYYERIMQLQESEWEFIAAHFDRKVFAKNQIITRQGETENHLSFIEEGIVRFYIPDDENELTFNFSFNREFTCATQGILYLDYLKPLTRKLMGSKLKKILKGQISPAYPMKFSGP